MKDGNSNRKIEEPITDQEIIVAFKQLGIIEDGYPAYEDPETFMATFKRCTALKMDPIKYQSSACERMEHDQCYA